MGGVHGEDQETAVRSGRGSHERSDVEVTCLSHLLWGAGHSLELRATDEFIHHVEFQQT